MCVLHLGRKCFWPILLIAFIGLGSACLGTSPPPYSGDLRELRFHILQAQQLDRLIEGDKEIKPQEGFVFLVVDIAVENISSQPVWADYAQEFTVKGRTASGDYEYGERRAGYYSSSSTIFGPIPPGFRAKMTKVFEIARTVGDLRLVTSEKASISRMWGLQSLTITDIFGDSLWGECHACCI